MEWRKKNLTFLRFAARSGLRREKKKKEITKKGITGEREMKLSLHAVKCGNKCWNGS